ncbi:MAG: lysophospholipid acyltransferase family protein, partial [Pseudomonadota bacterium]
ARFAMKRELLWMPVFGLYAWRTGAVALNRRPRYGAAEELVRAFADVPGQIVIYPQGTRVAPGVEAPYRRGITRMAEAPGRRIVPVATNAGLFWRKGGLFHGPGVAVIEFLDPVSGDLPRTALMAELTARIETASDRLTGEAAAS